MVNAGRTRTASVSRGHGYVVTRIDADASQTVADADENLAATIAACGTTQCPLLLDISRCLPLASEVRDRYSDQRLLASFAAIAILIEASALGRMMGNVYLRIARPPIPTRLFTDEASAIAWLRGFGGRES